MSREAAITMRVASAKNPVTRIVQTIIVTSEPKSIARSMPWYGQQPKENAMASDSTEEYEGFTKAQFMTALKASSRPMAERAMKAKKEGMLSTEESKKFLDDILNAGD